MGALKTWEVGEIKRNPQSQSKKGLKVEVKKKGGRGQKYKVLGTGCLGCDLFPLPPTPSFRSTLYTTQCLLSPNHFKYVKM